MRAGLYACVANRALLSARQPLQDAWLMVNMFTSQHDDIIVGFQALLTHCTVNVYLRVAPSLVTVLGDR